MVNTTYQLQSRPASPKVYVSASHSVPQSQSLSVHVGTESDRRCGTEWDWPAHNYIILLLLCVATVSSLGQLRDIEKQRQRRRDVARLTENGNSYSWYLHATGEHFDITAEEHFTTLWPLWVERSQYWLLINNATHAHNSQVSFMHQWHTEQLLSIGMAFSILIYSVIWKDTGSPRSGIPVRRYRMLRMYIRSPLTRNTQ